MRPASTVAATPTPQPTAPASLPPPTTPTTTPAYNHLVWSDEFEGPAGSIPNPSKWGFDTGGGGWGNNELQYYTASPQNASLDGHGDLVITARSEQYTGPDDVTRDYTSARLETLKTFQFTYGRMEASIQVPAGQGLLPAFWALGGEVDGGLNPWPGCGEIDAMEILGSEPNVLYGTLHGPWPSLQDGIGGKTESPTPLSAGFHVYGVEWTPTSISFMLDGHIYERIAPSDLPAGSPWPFDHPFFLLLNVAVGGNWPGPPNSSSRFPAQMLVHWVRVWRQA